ncbi:hypothetical protein [Amycolatopsis sp. La24]|uniref:hypothetical protein n=1 Tax=Amycolatopsis sp. La24 TaxID=3028304 RepID=UPI0023B12BB4|nr:hypothetical protein [Amycolatopsis sp. La24]
MAGKRAALAAVLIVAGTVSACGGSAAPPGPPPGGGTAGPAAGAPATETNPPGDIPDNQAYVPFSPPGGGFTVKIPEGWASTANGTTTTFTDKLNQVQVAVAPVPSAPTPESVRASDVPVWQKQVPRFALGAVSTVQRPAGVAVLAKYQGDSAPNPVTGKVVRDAVERYVFFHAGKRVDLTLSGPVNADNVDPWRTVTESLRWQ